MANHSARHGKKHRISFVSVVVSCLIVCIFCVGLYLWRESTLGNVETASPVSDDAFRPVIGNPPYRIALDAGHGGTDPGAQGIVVEKEMTAATAEALYSMLEADPNFLPLRTREDYDLTAAPSERAAAVNALSPDLLLSIHGNSAPE